jgi:hypothetical protein
MKNMKEILLKRLCKIIKNKHRKYITQKEYKVINMFFIVGNFSDQDIINIIHYGEKFIKDMKY